MNHHKAAAAQVAGLRMDYREGKANCHGRIYGVPTLPEYLCPNIAGIWVYGHDHPVFGTDRVTTGWFQRLKGAGQNKEENDKKTTP
jgi:hypothetical protein